MNILVVDDDDDMRELLTLGLSAYGHNVRTAKTGTAGLFHAEALRPDVVLLEMMFADMSGCNLSNYCDARDGPLT
jgi:DNA-binding response OmpR family regulator